MMGWALGSHCAVEHSGQIPSPNIVAPMRICCCAHVFGNAFPTCGWRGSGTPIVAARRPLRRSSAAVVRSHCVATDTRERTVKMGHDLPSRHRSMYVISTPESCRSCCNSENFRARAIFCREHPQQRAYSENQNSISGPGAKRQAVVSVAFRPWTLVHALRSMAARTSRASVARESPRRASSASERAESCSYMAAAAQ
jgi:hypothetical protein